MDHAAMFPDSPTGSSKSLTRVNAAKTDGGIWGYHSPHHQILGHHVG